MSVTERTLRWVSQRCLWLSLASLVLIAALTNAAYFLSQFGHWTLIRPMGPVVFLGAALMALTFVFGFVANAARVVLYTHPRIKEADAARQKTGERPAHLTV